MPNEPKMLIDVPNNRKKLAWAAMAQLGISTGILLSPWVDVERVMALMPVISTYYFTLGGIISVFIGGQFMANSGALNGKR